MNVMRKPPMCLLIAMAVLGLPPAAHASLGGNLDTITADQSRMSVRAHAVARAGNGALHTLSLANGGEVREYANASGVVYALRWTGPGKPDLESLLGPNFATLQADNPVAQRHGMRRPPSVNRANLRVVTGGHPGAFWGYAWLPQSVPSGFDPSSL
jgi:hypothetical protein